MAPCPSYHVSFRLANVVDHAFGPAVDVCQSIAVADPVSIGRYVDDIRQLRERRQDAIARLLIGDDDHAVEAGPSGRLRVVAEQLQRAPEIRTLMRLRGLEG